MANEQMTTETEPTEPETAFGRRLQEWMWSQRPPLTGKKLAGRLGIAAGTVWYWLNAGRLPQLTMLPKIAEVTGIPLEELYILRNNDLPASREQAEAIWASIISDLEHSSEVSDEDRATILKHVRELREQYFAGTGIYQKKP